ncbi:hypothetical protein AOQ84DRAFT_368433 [Glonium stellatum]|uniref:Uncharacterized protein n=1 Tax=Glonium stellatum TaxID=574774 RepID=A0A8E2JMZ4_9PEZI|nr:hypothetical protein AOQ84DRAFT_368433 [Glonium stellatum]
MAMAEPPSPSFACADSSVAQRWRPSGVIEIDEHEATVECLPRWASRRTASCDLTEKRGDRDAAAWKRVLFLGIRATRPSRRARACRASRASMTFSVVSTGASDRGRHKLGCAEITSLVELRPVDTSRYQSTPVDTSRHQSIPVGTKSIPVGTGESVVCGTCSAKPPTFPYWTGHLLVLVRCSEPPEIFDRCSQPPGPSTFHTVPTVIDEDQKTRQDLSTSFLR